MKKVTRILGLCALVALATVSCKKDDNNVAEGSKSFRATINQPTDGAKTHIGEWEGQQNYLLWNDNDAIMVYTEDGTSATFTTNDADVAVATFTGDIKEADKYVAFYPAANATAVVGNKVTLELPATQDYEANNIASGAYPMAAYCKDVTSDVDFEFHSPCAVVCLPLIGNAKVGSIELKGKMDEPLAGSLEVTLGVFDPANPTAGGWELKSSQKTVTLDCSNVDGVQLNGTAQNFYFVVATPMLLPTFFGGLEFTVKDTEGKTIKTLTAPADPQNVLPAETILTMPEIEIDYAYPTVTTLDATDVTLSSAVLNGEATTEEGTSLTECGFYYGTSEGQLNTKVQAASAASPFSYELTGLTPGTYYFKAYATNENGESCGEVKSFIISETGLLSGAFSVSPTKTVNFSKGNLQCERTTNGPVWHFAAHQYDRIGNANANIGQMGATIDLFGWGTSGYNIDAWTSSQDMADYGPASGDLTGDWDWGYNAITNGGNQENSGWRTLSAAEWAYLCPPAAGLGGVPTPEDYQNCRTTTTHGNVYGGGESGLCNHAHWAMAVVNGVNGLIILPDEFTYPSDIFNHGSDANYMYADLIPTDYATHNVYDLAQWAELEEAGCVFLPAGGWREGSWLSENVNTGCNYWSTTRGSNFQADNNYGTGSDFQYVRPNTQVTNCLHFGFYVRLVKDCE